MMKLAPRLPKVFIEDNAWGLYQVWVGGYDPGLELEKPVVLDIGANIGLATLYFEARYPGCTIHSYEPSPLNASALIINTWGNPDIHVTVKGVRAVSGQFPLYQGKTGHYSDSFHYVEGETNRDTVLAWALSARELPKCDVLKVDTEGCELEILQNYPHLEGVKALTFEWHSGADHEALLSLVKAQGFRVLRDEATCLIRGDLMAVRES